MQEWAQQPSTRFEARHQSEYIRFGKGSNALCSFLLKASMMDLENESAPSWSSFPHPSAAWVIGCTNRPSQCWWQSTNRKNISSTQLTARLYHFFCHIFSRRCESQIKEFWKSVPASECCALQCPYQTRMSNNSENYSYVAEGVWQRSETSSWTCYWDFMGLFSIDTKPTHVLTSGVWRE